MNVQLIKVSDFRKDLSEYFNASLAGVPVRIERGGITYKLIAEIPKGLAKAENIKVNKDGTITPIDPSKKTAVESKLGPWSQESTVGVVNAIHKEDVLKEFRPKFCKDGHSIPYPRDKCLGKGCKYS